MARSTKYRGLAVANAVKEEARWKAESDLRTMMEAERIKADPKRLAAVQSVIAEQKKDLASVAFEASGADKD